MLQLAERAIGKLPRASPRRAAAARRRRGLADAWGGALAVAGALASGDGFAATHEGWSDFRPAARRAAPGGLPERPEAPPIVESATLDAPSDPPPAGRAVGWAGSMTAAAKAGFVCFGSGPARRVSRTLDAAHPPTSPPRPRRFSLSASAPPGAPAACRPLLPGQPGSCGRTGVEHKLAPPQARD